ncbi:ubiquitin carboxyl-terminal hydrolase 21 [Aegilops tauschii subsp. strangulata]|uniref:Ubiquitin carboxyl-terminal hydrolase n=4 Tax=Aegilops tauschii subsp. strangulata TaxID=200361 RepID=A0A453PB45_AEGTS|nr:ubiquitin carboxyl-terminal hydrolase 21 [Aegilops tauschii subsp. strangulata]
MADDDAAASLSQPSPAKGDISRENGDEKSKQCQPFFSMCQPLQTVSYSNSWDSVCAPAATEPCQTSGLDSVDDEYMPSAPSFPDSQQPHSESISAIVDESNKLCSPPSPTDKECDVEQLQLESEELLDDSGVLDGETRQQSEPLTTDEPSSVDEIKKWGADTKQHSPPLRNTKHWSSNCALEPSDNENKPLSLFFSRFRQPQSVGAGLRNMGNTCFLNATLQCITHTVPLFKKLRCTDHSTPCSYDVDGFCSFCALKEHIEESIRRSGAVLVPARFKDNLSKLSSDFRPGQQEDAHEFLRCLLDNLHKCTLDPKSKGKPSSFDEESIVKQVFGGRLKSQLTCRDCGHCSETFEPFLDLSLEIDQVDDLVAALESFTKVEQVGDDENKLTCESCKVQVCKDKRLVLDKAPDVIAFQLKRFTTLDNSIEKIDKHVAYPSELDLKPFHNNPDKEELMYDLYGVVEHSGLPNYGHYVCTIRSSPSTWHLMNDSNVDSITETCALNQEAYILFYVRQGMFPWFSSLLEEARSGASPVSVLDNIDADRLTSSNRSPGDKFEIGETSECKTSLLAEEPTKRSSVDASNSTNKKEETTPLRISPLRASFQDDVGRRHAPSASEITNLERPSTPPPCPKRMISVDDFEVFKFEEFDDKDTPLMPKSEHQPKVKKPKAASASKSVKGPSVDKNATRLMRGMPSARRKGLLDCMISQQNVAQEPRRGSRSDPLGKKKRKLDTNSVAVLQY